MYKSKRFPFFSMVKCYCFLVDLKKLSFNQIITNAASKFITFKF